MKKYINFIYIILSSIAIFLASFFLWNFIKPEIVLKGGNIELEVNTKYIEPGYSLKILNKDLTNLVNIENNLNYKVLGEYSINYYLKQFKIISTRYIKVVDTTKPIITLNGLNNIKIYSGDKYKEPGYKALDNYDGDITNKVVVNGEIGINIGSYTLTYTIKDSSNNEVSITRIIDVIAKPIPPKPNNKSGYIYLTFDDGPSSNITPQVLDILKEENIKATFFIVGSSSSLDNIVKRAYNEGHSIAIHSASHNFNKVYVSETAFLNDFNIERERIKKITGSYTNIFRFPGGSSNTVSNYNPGIMTRLTALMTNMGYTYFDWNVSSGDGAVQTTTSVYNNVTKNLKINRINVVLMHDASGKATTLNALRDIIKFGKNNGYKFDRITESTPQIKHRIAN